MKVVRVALIFIAAIFQILFCTPLLIMPAIGGEKGRDLGEELVEMSKEQNVDIEFYGIVLDQNKDPVVEAKVIMGRRYFMLGSDKHEATTNTKGMFEITGVKGTYLSIRDISKQGYEFLMKDQNITKFDFWHGIPSKIFISSIDKPTVFTVRKKDKSIFLLRGEMSKKLIDKDIYTLDLIRNKMFQVNRNDYEEDVRISANREGSSYRLGFHVVSHGSGIILLRDPKYRAPISGYEREEYIQLDIGAREDIYVMVKTSSQLYARLDIVLTVHDENIICRINSNVNPYGSVMLEYDSYLPVEETVKLRKEAKSSLMRGEKPAIPDRYSSQ